jgi:hypothetical protein
MDDISSMQPSQEERMAPSLFRGVLAQVLRAAIEWLALRSDEVLICEREEDFDKVIREGEGSKVVAHQIKDLSDSISARDEAIRESIANFAIAFRYYDQLGVTCRFVFTTTAAAVVQRIDELLTVDVLKNWCAYSDSPPEYRDVKLVHSIKALEQYRKTGTAQAQLRYGQIAAAHAYLDQDRWDRFLRSVSWRLCSLTYLAVRTRLAETIADDVRLSMFASELIMARLVGEVLHRSANPEITGRILRPCDIDEIARETEAQHRQWAEKHSFASWVAGIASDLADVQERVSRLEAQAGVAAAEAWWPRYMQSLSQRLKHILLLGLPALQVPISSVLRVCVQRSNTDETPFEGRFLHLTDEARMLITGEPGAGKSGLTRLIAVTAAGDGLRVVRGRLKVLAAEVLRGVPFADALSACVADGFIAPGGRNRLISEAQLVLLDGLDETSTAYPSILEQLRNWEGPSRLVVTSRNQEDAVLLKEFAHFRVQPVEAYEATRFAREVSQIHGGIESATLDGIERLFSSHAELTTPLLAGFVLSIAFAAQGDPIPTTPARLYARILRLLAREARTDRTLEARMDTDRAIEVLDSLAWLQVETPSSDLLELKTKLRQAYGADGATAIDFWEERGLLEIRLTAIRDEIDFAHESLWEYCVARHINSLSAEEIERLASRNADKKSWSEIFDFAIQQGRAQPILRGVLKQGDHHRTLRAATLFMATQEPLDDTPLVERLLEVTASDIPTAVFEASAALAELVEQGRIEGHWVASKFPEHKQLESTADRLGALSIRISLVARSVQQGDIAEWVFVEADTHARHIEPFGMLSWWSAFQDVIILAMRGVYTSRGEAASLAFLLGLQNRELLTEYSMDTIREWAANISLVTVREAIDSMRAREAAAYAEKSKAKRMMSFEDFNEKRLEGLYLIFSEACPESGFASDNGIAFALTLRSIGYMERPTTESSIFMGPSVRGLLSPILRQWILALSLDPAVVGDYARSLLPMRPLMRTVTKWPRTPSRVAHWSINRLQTAGVQVSDLVSMLNRGSHNGLLLNLLAPIILHWQPKIELTDAIESQAEGFEPEMWQWLARNADAVWGDQFQARASQLLNRFDGPGTIWLLAAAPSNAAVEVRERLLRSLASTDIEEDRAHRVADARFAAWALGRITDAEVLENAWTAFRDWTQRPVTDNPREIPDSPLDILVEVILVRDASSTAIQELADHQSREVRKQLVAFLRKQRFNRETWDGLLGTKAFPHIVEAFKISMSEEELAWLLSQITKASPKERAQITEALARAPLTSAVAQALEALESDPDVIVRDRAFNVLRERNPSARRPNAVD